MTNSERKGGLLRATLASAIMTAVSEACVQVDLRSVENTNDTITDYETNEDELNTWIGVGEEVLYTWTAEMQRS